MELTAEIAAAHFDAQRVTALKNLAEKKTFDGFRPGQAPEAVIVRELGEEAVLWEMAKLAISSVYPAIITQEKIDALGRPDVSIIKIASGNPLGFKLTTAVMPQFQLPDYKQIARETNQAASQPEERRTKIIEAIMAKTEIKLPTILIEAELNQMVRELETQAASAGKNFTEELKAAGKTVESLRADWRGVAEKRVKANLILERVAMVEKLEPAADKIEADVVAVLANHPKADRALVQAYVRHSLTNNLAWELLEGQK